MRTHYRADDFQETCFVLGNLEELLDLARIDFGPYYGRVRDGRELAARQGPAHGPRDHARNQPLSHQQADWTLT